MSRGKRTPVARATDRRLGAAVLVGLAVTIIVAQFVGPGAVVAGLAAGGATWLLTASRDR